MKLPHYKLLKKVSAKICKKGDGRELLGTGTVVQEGADFYVLTAGHCFRDSQGNQIFKKEDVQVYIHREKGLEPFDVKDLQLDPYLAKDSAILKIDNPDNGFDFQQDIKLVADFNEEKSRAYGYIHIYPDGGKFDFEVIGDNHWRCIDKVSESGQNATKILKGLSGAGLFVEKDNTLYCIGYIKSTYDELGTMDDVVVYSMSNFNLPVSDNQIEVRSMQDIVGQPERAKNCNEDRMVYVQLWNKLYDAIFADEDVTDIIAEIRAQRLQYAVPKTVRRQEQLEMLLLRKRTPWQDSHKEAFLLALEDRGIWPSLYGQLPPYADGIRALPLTQKLERRGYTLMGVPSTEYYALDGNDDETQYERILRAAYTFEFEMMQKLLNEWHPKGFMIARKAWMESMFGEANDSKAALEAYISNREGKSLDRLFYATTMYNLAFAKWGKKISYKQFWDEGIDGISEVLNSIAANVDHQKDAIFIYGIHYLPIFGGEDNTSNPEALRVLQTIINAGVTTSLRSTYLLAKEDWLKVALHLLQMMPYPIVFYTLMYGDDKVSRRIGQEMAYMSEDTYLHKNLPEMMRRMLMSINHPATLSNLRFGLYYLSQELYVALPDKEWINEFFGSVLAKFCTLEYLDDLSYRDPLFLHVKEGISNLRTTAYKADVVGLLVKNFALNPILISLLFSDALRIDKELWGILEIRKQLQGLIAKQPLKYTHEIINRLVENDLMDEDLIKIVDDKVKIDALDFGIEAGAALGELSWAVSAPDAVARVKQETLKLDIWNCGIEGNSMTDPRPIQLHCYNNEILNWTPGELSVIFDNLEKNLSLMQQAQERRMTQHHFDRLHIILLMGMRDFIKKEGSYDKGKCEDLLSAVERMLEQKRGFAHPYTAISSSDYETVVEGAWMLSTLIEENGIESYHSCVELLISRVLLQQKEALETCLSMLSGIVMKHPDYMAKHFYSQIIEILKKYSEVDYRRLEVALPQIHLYMHKIAENISKVYKKGTPIDYWLNDPEANRFNL